MQGKHGKKDSLDACVSIKKPFDNGKREILATSVWMDNYQLEICGLYSKQHKNADNIDGKNRKKITIHDFAA